MDHNHPQYPPPDRGFQRPHGSKGEPLSFVSTYPVPEDGTGVLNLQTNRRQVPESPYQESINTPDIRHFHENRDEMNASFDNRDLSQHHQPYMDRDPHAQPHFHPQQRHDMPPTYANDLAADISAAHAYNAARNGPPPPHPEPMPAMAVPIAIRPPAPMVESPHQAMPEQPPAPAPIVEEPLVQEPPAALVEEPTPMGEDSSSMPEEPAPMVEEPAPPPEIKRRKIERHRTRPRELEVDDDNLTYFGSFWWMFVAGNYARLMLKKQAGPDQQNVKQETKTTVACEDCEEKFDNLEDLETHALVHLGSYLYSCSTCRKPFSKLCALRRHQSTHEKKEAYSCMGCQQGFFFYSKLKSHHRVCEPMKAMNPALEQEEVIDYSSEEDKPRRKMRRRKKRKVRRVRPAGEVGTDGTQKRKQSRPRKVKVEYVEVPAEGEEAPEEPLPRVRKRRERISLAAIVDAPRKNVCKICPDRPEIEDMTMEAHILEQHPDHVLRCRVCMDAVFYKESFYRKHYMQEHPDKNPFECNVCGKCFKNRERWQQHEFLHTGMKEFACDKCPKKFAFKSYLDRHIINCHIGREVTYFCDKCGKGFKYGRTYKRHMLEHKGRNYPCPVCNFFFLTAADLEKHRIVHLNIQKFFCEKCGKGFKYRTGYEEHLKTHNPKTLQCELCAMKFNREESLQRHQDVHTGTYSVYCQFCQKGFRKKIRLRKHILNVHSNEHNLQPIPPDQIQAARELQNQKRQVKPKKPRPPQPPQPQQQLTPCTMCDKLFATQAGLNAHMKTHEMATFQHTMNPMPQPTVHYQTNPPNLMNPIMNPIMNPVYHPYLPPNHHG